MGAHGEGARQFEGYFQFLQTAFSWLFGSAETLISTDTLHVEDYSKIVADVWEAALDRKLKHHREVFPLDCEKAFEMGARFARESR